METKNNAESTTPAVTPKTKPTKVRKTKATPRKSGSVSLGQAQQSAQSQMESGSASLDQVHAFLSRKPNKGKYFGPGQIAVGIGDGCTDKSVRKAMQRAGLAKGKNAVIAAPGDKDWLALHKAGNRNTYCAFTANTNPPAAQ